MNKLLIWDIDGTLIDSKGSGRRAMDKTFQNLYKVENGFDKISMSGRLDWQIVMDALKKHKVEDEDVASFLCEYGKTLMEELKCNNCARIFPGVKEILDITANNTDVYHALGTGNCEKGAILKLAHLKLDTYFEIGGFGDEDLERWQVIDRVILKAKDYYDVDFKKENIYVIGDTSLDIECGKKNGVKTIAVATGSCSYEELLQYSPSYIFQSFERCSDFLSVILDNQSIKE